MGKRKRHAKQDSMWVATQDLPRSAAHPFYVRLNQIRQQRDFDAYVEGLCERFYADDTRQAIARSASNPSKSPISSNRKYRPGGSPGRLAAEKTDGGAGLSP